MTFLIQPYSKLVMIGDSITDCGRRRPIGTGSEAALGNGYVHLTNALLTAAYPDHHIDIVNMGISGNTVRDLHRRWQTDVLDLKPAWLAVKIGINDVWRQFERGRMREAVQLAEFGRIYNTILAQVRPQLKGLILLTPYYIQSDRNDPMRARMDEYGAVVKQIASAYDAILVDTQAAFDAVLEHVAPTDLAADFVHPDTAGHMILARAFLTALGFKWS